VSALVARFARIHRAQPDRALIHVPAEGSSLTADDIWRAHLAYEACLRAGGLRAGQLLVIATGNRAPTVPLLLAARSLGLAVAAVDSGTTSTELAAVADQFDAAALVVREADAGSTMPGGLSLSRRNVSRDGGYAGTAILKITSGSTGLPKAARTTDAQLIGDSEQIVAGMGIGPDDTQIAVIPLTHAYGVSVILVPLLLQGTPMVLRESFVPQQLSSDAAAFGARTFPGVPYMFDYFLAHRPARGWPPGLRTLISAGAPLPAWTIRGFLESFGIKIHSFYGASECGGIAYDADDTADGADTVGTPLPGVTITLRPDDDAPMGSGRVHVRGAGVAGGYVGQASDDFSDAGFLTGDYGTFDGRGRLRLTGRVSTFINVAGKKVQPAEVEQVLRQMPGVRDVRVVGAADPQRGEQVVACLAVDPSHAPAVGTMAVRTFCSSRLASYKIPRAVVLLDAIPLTARGKTDRQALHAVIRARIEGITEQMC
jgi:long-chain acyl-CoA synthetase